MRVCFEESAPFELDIDLSLLLADAAALISAELSIPLSQLSLSTDMLSFGTSMKASRVCLLDTSKSLSYYGVTRDSVIYVKKVARELLEIQKQLLGHPITLAQMEQKAPGITAAVVSGVGLESFLAQLMNDASILSSSSSTQSDKMIVGLDDETMEMSAEVQAKIEAEIQQQNIHANLESALEHHPESFADITMLYIRCKINGHSVAVFVDSGAQATIMSPQLAEKTGLMRLLDRRWAGIAKGVGMARILGRIHSCPLQFDCSPPLFLPCTFTIVDVSPERGKGADVDILLGLDMLKRHLCCIDCKRNGLQIGDHAFVPFLPESEIPRFGRAYSEEEKKEIVQQGIPTSNTNSSIASTSMSLSSSSSSTQQKQWPSSTSADKGNNEDNINHLMNILGDAASREEIASVLAVCGGNVDTALNILLENK